jgi:hypothetical protein
VLPFERLRSLARYVGDDRALVIEAADCLADFGDEPTQLVTACRRLVAHHATNGMLWWLCAHVLTAADPASGAREATRALERDRTASRLSSLLPFPHDDAVAVLGWPDVTGAALTERPDLDVVSVRLPGVPRRHAERRLRVLDEVEALAAGPTHLLVEAQACGPARAVVPSGTGDLARSLDRAQLWLVVPTGHLLPARLFDVLAAQLGDDEDAELLEASDATETAGPWGLESPDRLARHVDCPVAPELLRL